MVGRYGSMDASDRGDTYRYSLARSNGSEARGRRSQRSGVRHRIRPDAAHNFTFYLDDPVHGDQNEQQDHRFITGVKAFQKRQSRWAGYAVENTYGVQVRNDDVSNLALIHTEHGVPLSTRAQASAIVTTAGVYGENRIEWVPWLRTTAGLRVDGSYYTVDDKLQSVNSGTSSAGIVSPKGTVTLGPWRGTELTSTRDSVSTATTRSGRPSWWIRLANPVDRVTPLVRAKGAEVGVRTVACLTCRAPCRCGPSISIRSSSTTVMLGATEPGPASGRYGIEFANYYAPKPWLVFDGDVAWSHARFTEFNEAGQYVPGGGGRGRFGRRER